MMITKEQTSARTGLSVATLRRLAMNGAFPPLVRLSERRVAWDSEAVDQWLAERERIGPPNAIAVAPDRSAQANRGNRVTE